MARRFNLIADRFADYDSAPFVLSGLDESPERIRCDLTVLSQRCNSMESRRGWGPPAIAAPPPRVQVPPCRNGKGVASW
jgi:hypothetical protein